MPKNEIPANHFIVEFYWMTTMGLKGSELRLYALIFSYSQDTKGGFFGSIEYLANRLDISRRQVFRLIDLLIEKKLIEKSEYYKNHVKYVSFEIIPNEFTSDKMSLPMTKRHKDDDKMSKEPVSECHLTDDKMTPNNKEYIKGFDINTIVKDVLDKSDILEKLDKSSKLEDEIAFSKNHVLTRYLVNARYLTKTDELEFFRYDNFFNKFIGKNGFEFDDYKLYVQYFIYRNKERIKNWKLKSEPIENKYGYFITAMESARKEFSRKKL
ncbi:MAG: helix-turn-helix domain-containing protein [Firmicutes bacterium]|nr:helix-turn-helix domain-containing protein [Bacillota bacterium]